MASAYAASAAARSPCRQAASPISAVAAPRPRWSSSGRAARARCRPWSTWRRRRRASGPARRGGSATSAGSRRNSSGSATTMPAGLAAAPLGPPPPTARRPAAGARPRRISPVDIRAPTQPLPSTGRTREHLLGQRSEPAPERRLASLPAQRRDRQLDEVGGPVEVAGRQRVLDGGARSPFCSCQSLARAVQLGRPGRAARRGAGPAARRRRGGGSGTTGGGRRAGPGTGCRRSSASSMARPPSCPVTASHSGPVSRSRTEVCSRKSRTSSGWRCSDLLDEVVDDVAVVAREAVDEAGDVVAPLQRQGGELERGDPALGPPLEGADVVGGRAAGPSRR